MVNITYDEGVEKDEQIEAAIEHGIGLARELGYGVDELVFEVRSPKNYPYGATAQILGEALIGIALDKDNPNYDFVSQLVVHEVNHTAREKYCRIETLEEALVSEGLAQMAEREAGFKSKDLSLFQADADRSKAITSMSGDFNSFVLGDHRDPEKGYDHYFGPEKQGYALGLDIVETFMEGTGATLQQATETPAAEIASYWRNTL